MGQPQSAEVMQRQLDQLDRDIDAHKRIARQNRDQASAKSTLREELHRFCELNGIPIRTQERRT